MVTLIREKFQECIDELKVSIESGNYFNAENYLRKLKIRSDLFTEQLEE
jgi:hypothetical protein